MRLAKDLLIEALLHLFPELARGHVSLEEMSAEGEAENKKNKDLQAGK